MKKPTVDHSFIERIQTLIHQAGGQSALARRTGLSLGAIQRYLKGGEPARGALIRLATGCDVSVNWLMTGEATTHPPAIRQRDIPVSGFAECGLQGWHNEVPYRLGTALDWPDPALFAVIAAGHSMAPEGIHPGYICIVSPATRPQKNDAVLIRRKDQTSTIKLYRHEDQDWLHVTGWLDPEIPSGTQERYHDQILRSTIEQLAPVIMVKRRA